MFLFGGKSMGRGSRPRTKPTSEVRTTTAAVYTVKNPVQGIRGWILPALICCLTLGTIFGAIYANVIDILEYNRLSANVEYFFHNSGEIIQNREAIFFETLIKYGKTPLLIWFLAFIPSGALVSFIFIFVKGVGVGFTTALLSRRFGAAGIYYAAILYLLQNLAIIPAYMYISFESLNFAADAFRIPSPSGSSIKKTAVNGLLSILGDTFTPGKFIEYLFAIIISFGCVVLAALAEAYCVPFLMTLY